MSRQHQPRVIQPEPLTYAAVREVAEQMNLLKSRLGGLHLFKTMHALDEATRSLGYEAADALAGIETGTAETGNTGSVPKG